MRVVEPSGIDTVCLVVSTSELEGKVDRFDTDVDPGYLAFDRVPIKLDSHNVLA